MRNATGQPQRIAVLGGTSEIAQHAVRAVVAAGGVQEAVLTARDVTALEPFAAALEGTRTRAVAWTAGEDAAAGVVDELWRDGDVDVLLVAVGQLPDQDAVETDPALLPAVVAANFTGPAEVCLRAAARLREQGHGLLVVLSSVAAERPRADNYVYGATKAALDALATGLGDRLHGSGVEVVVVRPGFVHTRMTEGLDPAPLAASPEQVGAIIADAVARGGTRTVWAPGPLRVVMSGLRHLPRPIFRRLAAGRS